MRTAIAIAAGGGGDAVTAAILAAARPELGIVAVMSWSWDRFMIDPMPGPRGRGDFDGLGDIGGVARVLVRSGLRRGRSTLPPLAGDIDLPLLLLEPEAGAVGLGWLMAKAVTAFGASELIVVDVGGDILAQGHERTLRTPLADSLALAGAMASGIDTRVVVAGIGLDGELGQRELSARLELLDARELGVLGPEDVGSFDRVWSWHPSEANGLLAAAAKGWRGRVETQRNALIELTDRAPVIYEVNAKTLADASLAAVLADTTCLDEAEQMLRDRRDGRSELDIERRRALAGPDEIRTPTRESLAVVDNYAEQARVRGVDALTLRRVAELVFAIDPAATGALRELLARERSDRFRPPLYLVN